MYSREVLCKFALRDDRKVPSMKDRQVSFASRQVFTHSIVTVLVTRHCERRALYLAMTQDTGLLFAEKLRNIHGMQQRIRDPSKSRDLAFES